VVLRAYYTSLKGCPFYRKRIKWLDSKPWSIRVSHRRNAVERIPHGNARKEGVRGWPMCGVTRKSRTACVYSSSAQRAARLSASAIATSSRAERCTDVTADNSTVSDDAIQRLLDFVRQRAPEHVEYYFQKHVVASSTQAHPIGL